MHLTKILLDIPEKLLLQAVSERGFYKEGGGDIFSRYTYIYIEAQGSAIRSNYNGRELLPDIVWKIPYPRAGGGGGGGGITREARPAEKKTVGALDIVILLHWRLHAGTYIIPTNCHCSRSLLLLSYCLDENILPFFSSFIPCFVYPSYVCIYKGRPATAH